jgi:hypothetical protein
MGKITARELPTVARWSGWWAAALVLGVGVGFTFELTRPRVPALPAAERQG